MCRSFFSLLLTGSRELCEGAEWADCSQLQSHGCVVPLPTKSPCGHIQLRQVPVSTGGLDQQPAAHSLCARPPPCYLHHPVVVQPGVPQVPVSPGRAWPPTCSPQSLCTASTLLPPPPWSCTTRCATSTCLTWQELSHLAHLVVQQPAARSHCAQPPPYYLHHHVVAQTGVPGNCKVSVSPGRA